MGKPMWDWMDKHEGRKKGDSTKAHAKEMKRQGYGAKLKKMASKSNLDVVTKTCNRHGMKSCSRC